MDTDEPGCNFSRPVLLVYPVLLGGGKRFFADNTGPRELALVSTKATPTGVLMNTYRHVGSLRSKADAARERPTK